MTDIEKKTYRWRLANEPHIALLRNGDTIRTLILNGDADTVDAREVAKWVVASAEACMVDYLKDDPVKVEKVKGVVGS